MQDKAPWPTCTPEEAGIPSQAVEAYLRAVNKKDLYMHSLLILRNGKCLTETYWKPIDASFKHRLYSCSKSFVAVAAGIAMQQGCFALDSKAISFFPEYVHGEPHPYLAMMTVRDILRMATCWSTGSTYSPACTDWIQTFFDDQVTHVPGTVFNYCTAGTTMLCAIIKRTTGHDFMHLLRPVFDKIGIADDVFCVEAPVGNGEYIEWGGSGVVMTPRDFARFANLIMHNGIYDGEEILPSAYIAEATANQIDNGTNGFSTDPDGGSGYGYQFWRMSHSAFSFNGMGGQFALCIPDQDIVLVTTGYEQLRTDDRRVIFSAFWQEIWPYISDVPLPANPSACESLTAFSQSLQMAYAKGAAHASIEPQIHAQTFVFDAGNCMGMQSCRFLFENDSLTWEYTNATGEHTLRIGLCRNIEQPFPERYCDVKIDQKMPRGYRSFVSGAWTAPDTLTVQIEVVDIYLAQLFFKICFKENTVTLFGEKHAEWFMNEYAGFASGRAQEGSL